jgi:hypothetical protein
MIDVLNKFHQGKYGKDDGLTKITNSIGSTPDKVKLYETRHYLLFSISAVPKYPV